MMSTEQEIALYEAIAATTGRMLDAARQNNWERLGELESRCSSLVQDLKDNPSPLLTGVLRDRKLELINQALDNHRAIRDVVDTWRAQLSSLISNTRTARKLSDAYFPRSSDQY